MSDEDLAGIRAREAAATPGPWWWGGNTDNGDPTLRSRATDVLGHFPVERTRNDRSAKRLEDYVRTLAMRDDAGLRPLTDEEVEQEIREEYLEDKFGQTETDIRLGFVVDGWYTEARKLAIYEVAREATDRNDPKVYRADIVGLRHPDAEFIAHAREDIRVLLAEVDRLQGIINEAMLVKNWTNEDGKSFVFADDMLAALRPDL